MTYSVFGCVVVEREAHAEHVLRAMLGVRSRGVSHHVGEHGLLSRGNELQMLREQGAFDPARTAVPFYLTRDAGEDNSHALVREDGMHASLHESGVPDWLSTISDIPHVVGVELFITEGYDNAFTKIECGVDDVADVLRANVLLPTGDYPSIHLFVRPPNGPTKAGSFVGGRR